MQRCLGIQNLFSFLVTAIAAIDINKQVITIYGTDILAINCRDILELGQRLNTEKPQVVFEAGKSFRIFAAHELVIGGYNTTASITMRVEGGRKWIGNISDISIGGIISMQGTYANWLHGKPLMTEQVVVHHLVLKPFAYSARTECCSHVRDVTMDSWSAIPTRGRGMAANTLLCVRTGRAPRSSAVWPGVAVCCCRSGLDPWAGQLSFSRYKITLAGGGQPATTTAAVTGPGTPCWKYKMILFLQSQWLLPNLIQNVKNQFPCPLGANILASEINRNYHLLTHTRETVFRCRQCDKTYLNERQLAEHFKIHNFIKKLNCDICGKLFFRECNLANHKKIHTGECPFCCEMCGKIYTRKTTLTRHSNYHTGKHPYTCDHCDKSFHRKGKLLHHIRFHTGERPFRCDFCSASFTRKTYLNNHKCEFCGKSFTQKSSLEDHLKLHAFFYLKYLLVYIKIRTGKRSFACKMFNKYFAQSSNLNAYFRHYHEKYCSS
ncbi:hypothetical protein PR048_025979 [Dryococelus australis]|uniref:C2H2-type domain-containing protein n=1 Tax=Dryococelus australis TaxID=614101 RepID=A0ABQ9GK22_9NEOP|nr:hypothetical protein PR048_025979 [Dryococelus australis]